MKANNVPTDYRDADPPFRYLEMLIAADALGAGTAAILALRSPGLLGVLRFCAARGDSLLDVATLLDLKYSEIDAVLAATTLPEPQDAL